MLRSKLITLALAGACAIALTGCPAAGRRPGETTPPGGAVTPGPGTATDRGVAQPATADPSATLVSALAGPAGRVEAIVLGNTALVAMMGDTTAAGGGTTPGTTGAAPGAAGGAAPGAAGGAAPGAAGGAAPGAPGGEPGAAGGTPPAGPAGAPGAMDTGRIAAAVQGSLPWIREVRVATDEQATRLSSIAAQIRGGRPATDFLTEISGLLPRMTRVPVAGTAATPGAPAVPGALPAPGAAPGGATGTTPGTAPAPAGGR